MKHAKKTDGTFPCAVLAKAKAVVQASARRTKNEQNIPNQSRTHRALRFSHYGQLILRII